MAEPWDLSEEARGDLGSIWLYGAETWSPEQAERYYDALLDAFDRLAEFPKLGRPIRKGGTPALRCLAHRAHLILYRRDADGILILRVLDARQDWLALMGEG